MTAPETLKEFDAALAEYHGAVMAGNAQRMVLARAYMLRLIERLSASEATGGEVKPMKLLGYANASRIRMTCASKPGGAHLGQVAIYAGESVDPMESQGLENLMWKEDRL